jgi:hypothetical protein
MFGSGVHFVNQEFWYQIESIGQTGL